MTKRMETNQEGLTWKEWFYASCANNMKFKSMFEQHEHIQELYKAWRNGEDPTEYRNVTTPLSYRK